MTKVANPSSSPLRALVDWRNRGARWKRLWAPKSFQFTSLDLDGSVLRVVQTIRGKRKSEVLRFAAKPLSFPKDADPENPAVAGAAIAQALKELKITPGQVVMGLPRASVLLRSMSFPAPDDPDELAAMVHFQIGKELPFPADEAVIDFMRQPPLADADENPPPFAAASGAAEEKAEALAAAARKEVVEKFVKIAEAAGFELIALGLLPHAHARCIDACQLAGPGDALALVTLRPDEVIFDVLAQGALVFSRTAPLKHHPPEEEPAADADAPSDDGSLDPAIRAAQIELVRTLHSYDGTERHRPVKKVFVVGNTGLETAAVRAFGHRLDLPCQLLEPGAALGLGGAENENAAGALAAIGLGLGVADPEGLPIDFLHPKRPPPPKNIRRVLWLAGTAAALLGAAAIFGLRAHLIAKHLKIKQSIQQQAAAEQKNQLLYRRERFQARAVQDWLQQSQSWLDHLALLSAILPANTDLYLSAFSANARGDLQLSVQARTSEILSRLDPIVRQPGYLVKPIAVIPIRDNFGYPFRSTLDLEVAPGKILDFSKVPGFASASAAASLAKNPPPAARRPKNSRRRRP